VCLSRHRGSELMWRAVCIIPYFLGHEEACSEAARMIKDMIDGRMHIGRCCTIVPATPFALSYFQHATTHRHRC